MRRYRGVAAVEKRNETKKRFDEVAEQANAEALEACSRQVGMLKAALHSFAVKHGARIRTDASFRDSFLDMCTTLGVDPIVSNRSIWSHFDLGSFYAEVAVQVMTVCLARRASSGGLIELDECMERMRALRGPHAAEVSKKDILKAVDKMKVFGESGIQVVNVEGRQMLSTLPSDLSADHLTLVDLAKRHGNCITKLALSEMLPDWTDSRCIRALTYLIREGILWVDDASECKRIAQPDLQTIDTHRSFWLLEKDAD